jgi:predicted amidohydrolase YtcJ
MACDLILYNAVIHPMDPGAASAAAPGAPKASAVAMDAGRIVLVGGDEEARRLPLHPGGEAIDLSGACILPGLTDSHIHFQWFAESLDSVDAGTRKLEQALERVARAADSTLPAATDRPARPAWIRGSGWDHNLWGGLPSRRHLDRAAPDRPVALTAKSGHALWASSAALAAAGVDARTPDPAGGRIGREEDGELSGILYDNAMDLVLRRMPKSTPEETASRMEAAMNAVHRLGLTGIHDFDGTTALSAFQILKARNALRLRVLKGVPSDLLGSAVGLGVRSGFGDEWLSIGAVKLFADGALGPQTAWMLEPYEGTSDRGIATLGVEEMAEEILQANANGLDCAVHAIGDAACRDVLDAFQRAERALAERRRAGPPRADAAASARSPHNRIEHVQLLHPADLPRLARLGLTASMQPIHATSDMDIAERHWGGRCATSYAWRSLLDHGTLLAFGSDCPVESPAPLAGIHAAATRRRPDGSPGKDGWRPEQRIAVLEAVRAYTEGAARACGREGDLGRIAPGTLADLTILDRDIAAVDPREILEAAVLATIVGGSFAYRDRALG